MDDTINVIDIFIAFLLGWMITNIVFTITIGFHLNVHTLENTLNVGAMLNSLILMGVICLIISLIWLFSNYKFIERR